jgi:transposase
MTSDLLEMSDWLAEAGVTHVAMESTGVFWKPIWNLLEGRFEILLVNARHIKQVPGRKTDVKDCEWIAQLLQHGLLRGSFVPPRPVRELRDLIRHRAKLIEERSAVVNRIHKILEDANVKLGAVASDIVGVSGLAMLDAIVAGEDDPHNLADLARRRLRGKIPELRRPLQGRITEHQTFREWNLDQHLLFPPSVRDLVPEGHLAHFVSHTTCEGLDLSEILGSYDEERGYPPYHPVMMTTLLLYAYCQGIYSSRRIFKACQERVDFMAVTAMQRPDFRTISDFRKRHLAALGRLFVQVLRLCQEQGLVTLGHVALDGTKVKANASKH